MIVGGLSRLREAPERPGLDQFAQGGEIATHQRQRLSFDTVNIGVWYVTRYSSVLVAAATARDGSRRRCPRGLHADTAWWFLRHPDARTAPWAAGVRCGVRTGRPGRNVTGTERRRSSSRSRPGLVSSPPARSSREALPAAARRPGARRIPGRGAVVLDHGDPPAPAPTGLPSDQVRCSRHATRLPLPPFRL